MLIFGRSYQQQQQQQQNKDWKYLSILRDVSQTAKELHIQCLSFTKFLVYWESLQSKIADQ